MCINVCYVCLLGSCLVLEEVRRGWWIPWTEVRHGCEPPCDSGNWTWVFPGSPIECSSPRSLYSDSVCSPGFSHTCSSCLSSLNTHTTNVCAQGLLFSCARNYWRQYSDSHNSLFTLFRGRQNKATCFIKNNFCLVLYYWKLNQWPHLVGK